MSESSNTPQSFDVVLGGNNLPKSQPSQKKVGKPKLKEKVDLDKDSKHSADFKNISNNNSSSENNVVHNEQLSIEDDNQFKTIIKIIVWSLMFWAGLSIEYSEATTKGQVATILFTLSWIVGLICPNAVIRFGLPNDTATVSKLYTTLIALSFTLFCIPPEFNKENSNFFLELFVSFICGFFPINRFFVLLFPNGTIFENTIKEEYEGNRFKTGCSLILFPVSFAITWILIVLAWQLVVSAWKFVF